jgi:DNA-binding NarL/FixJ family response regulator
MNSVMVAVCSADALALPGVSSLLADRPAVTVVPRDKVGEADIAMVVTDEVDETTLDLVHWITRSSSARTLLVTDHLTRGDSAMLARCRVSGLLNRRAVTRERLSQAIDEALSGDWAPVLPVTELAECNGGGDGFTARERQLLRLLADGHDTVEIARLLAYSERTVKKIVHQMLTRLRLRNRAHAVAHAMRAGLL